MKKVCCILFFIIFLASCAHTPETKNLPPADSVTLDEAITQATQGIAAKFPAGTRVAVVRFKAMSAAMSDYLFDELSDALVDKGMTVADRDSLKLVLKEQHFQLSGYVDDDTAVAIGKLLGAKSVIQGELLDVGNALRFRVIALNVETGQQELAIRKNILHDEAFDTLLTSLNNNKSVTKDAAY
jgi:hypothetical protein